MNRLPAFDRATQRGELASFAGLALAGVAIIAMAGAQMTRFAAGQESVAQALAAPNAVTAAVSSNPPAGPLLSATHARLVLPLR